MDQRIIDLYDAYTHTPLRRRVFLDRLAQLSGGMAAALALLPLLEADKAAAAQVAPDDARLEVRTVTFATDPVRATGYQARPKQAREPLPGVVVVHENRGLNPHIQDVARRFAAAGFFALAPDFLSPLGGTPADEDAAREMFAKLDPAQTVAIAEAAVDWLRGPPDARRRVGIVGFCWGGGVAGQAAAAGFPLDAAVVFYGSPPKPEQVADIKAPLLLHYAGLDERINAAVPAFRAALDRAGTPYELHMYEGANHAFHNDTAQARYDPAAAKLAWERTVTFLTKTLTQR